MAILSNLKTPYPFLDSFNSETWPGLAWPCLEACSRDLVITITGHASNRYVVLIAIQECHLLLETHFK